MKIIVGFSRPKGWFEPFAWLIMLATWSDKSHAYIKYFDECSQKTIIFQASGLKVNFVGETLFNSKENTVTEFEIPISDKTMLATRQFAVDNCGIPYAVGQICGFALVLFMRLFGKSVKNPFYGNSSFFCSELIETILNEIMDENDTLSPGSCSPKDLCNFLLSKGYKPINGG